ncbi:MAG: hypothetical protein M3Q96_02565 [Pseudomonadota bacterium]|nr:hypothetical protein [Pseudomonadota bacterium]
MERPDIPDPQDHAQAFAQRIDQGADAARIGEAVASTWEDIAAALSPVLGSSGVALLFKRSLHLIAPAHPWLARTHEGAQVALDIDALKSVFAQQADEAAANAGVDLLLTFHALLAGLIGPSLTERLLRSVTFSASSSPQAKDTSP